MIKPPHSFRAKGKVQSLILSVTFSLRSRLRPLSLMVVWGIRCFASLSMACDGRVVAISNRLTSFGELSIRSTDKLFQETNNLF